MRRRSDNGSVEDGGESHIAHPISMATDGEEFEFHDDGQSWIVSWFPPNVPYPSGKPQGSTAICLTPETEIVLVSSDGKSWEFPGGRPEANEDLRATLDREVTEEACARVEKATLLGFSRGTCVQGRELGLVLVRSLWRADVSLQPWEPRHEKTHRLLVHPDEALERMEIPEDILPIYLRWFHDAMDPQLA